jgi:hypothetical protein
MGEGTRTLCNLIEVLIKPLLCALAQGNAAKNCCLTLERSIRVSDREMKKANKTIARSRVDVRAFEVNETVVAYKFKACAVCRGRVPIGMSAVSGGVFQTDEPTVAEEDGLSSTAKRCAKRCAETFDLENVDDPFSDALEGYFFSQSLSEGLISNRDV